MRGRLWCVAHVAALVAGGLVACSSPERGFDVPAVHDATDDTRPIDVARNDVATDTGVDVPTGAACNGNDDCVAPDLCSNAQRCMFGHCVVVGGTDSCDDTYACTDDSCDATHGRCVHVPNDMRCPTQQYCALGAGCVRELPCEIGDATCAHLNNDACTGTWSCDAARLVCVRSATPNCDDSDPCTTDACMASGTSYTCTHNRASDFTSDPLNCGGCGMACPVRANAATACSSSDCHWTCSPMYVDLDGDLAATPRTATSTGCECHVTDPADRPDLAFVDSNCDGIDGTVTNAIFVASSTIANDTNPGTMALPMATIGAAIALAGTSRPPKDVYVAVGTYPGMVTLASGVSIYGGYDDAHGWSRSASNVTTVQSDSTTGVYGNALTAPVELQLLTVRAMDAAGPGVSSYGVRLNSAGAMVTVRGCNVYAGNGANGANGSNGANGANGGGGGAGGNTAGRGGSVGTSMCGAAGGAGGHSVSGETAGQVGLPGVMVAGGGTNGHGGTAPDGYGVCHLPDHGDSKNAPDNATIGLGGANGTNGPTASDPGSFAADGTFSPSMAPSGTAGHAGGGGGGGASGGGENAGCGFANLSCCSSSGGGGGGGGGGGCPGSVGTGGSGGGGSFAIVSAGSPLSVLQSRLFTGRGGAGGSGGSGGTPGTGGQGGQGGAHTSEAGDGAPGKAGGNAGPSGSGSGGPGGPSICVQYVGTAPTIDMLTCTRGAGGTGGNGGSSTALGTAPNGPSGAAEDVRAGS